MTRNVGRISMADPRIVYTFKFISESYIGNTKILYRSKISKYWINKEDLNLIFFN